MVQRASEAPRKGKTIYEDYVAYLYQQMGLGAAALRDHALCFGCGKYFRTDGKHYPSTCLSCGRVLGKTEYEYCMPDFIITRGKEDKFAVLFVNGEIHEKSSRRKKKDRNQIDILTDMGIPTFVITNEQLRYSEVPMLIGYLSSIWFMLGTGADPMTNPIYKSSASDNCHKFIKKAKRQFLEECARSGL